MPGIAGHVAVDLLEVRPPGARSRIGRGPSTRGCRRRAPASPWRSARRPARHRRPRSAGSRRTWSGSSSVRMPEVERLVRALAHAARLVVNVTRAPGSLIARAPGPADSAVSSSSSRPDTSPSSLRRSVSSSARPTAGPSGTPAASRSSPGSRGQRRAGRSPSGGSARRSAERQRQRERLARLPASRARSSDGACSRSRSAWRSVGPPAPRATRRRARSAAGSGRRATGRASRGRPRPARRARSPRGRPRSPSPPAPPTPPGRDPDRARDAERCGSPARASARPRPARRSRASRSISSSRTRAPETVASAPLRHRLPRQPLGLRLQREPEPRRVPHGAQQPRGVVEEAAVVEHPDQPRSRSS